MANSGTVAFIVLFSAVLCACGGEDPGDTTTTGGGGSAPLQAGATFPCTDGLVPDAGGNCFAPGVPTDGCGDGFVHDGDDGCTAVLVDAPCAQGMVAFLGETTCHALGDCGSGAWGTIVGDATTQYVDAAYVGGSNDGSQQAPWTTIGEAVAAAADGALVAVAAGTYQEDVLVDGKAITLAGRCPSMVQVEGIDATTPAVGFKNAMTGSVRGLSVSGPGLGIAVRDMADFVVEDVWIHDTTLRSFHVAAPTSTTHATARRVLIDHASEAGSVVVGASADFEDVVVRQSAPMGAYPGFGIDVEANATTASTRAQVSLTRVVIDEAAYYAVNVLGSDLTMDSVLIRNTQPSAEDGAHGAAAIVIDYLDDGASIDASRSVIESNRETGLLVAGSDAALDAMVIADTDAQLSDGLYGQGLSARATPAGPSSLGLSRSLLRGNRLIGLRFSGSTGAVDATVVRDTRSKQATGEYGRGVEVNIDPLTLDVSNAAFSASLIEGNRDVGVLVLGSQLTMDRCVVRNTQPRTVDMAYGRGMHVQPYLDSPTDVTVSSSLFDANHEAGVSATSATFSMQRCEVRATTPEVGLDDKGDGVVFFGDLGASDAEIIQSTIANNTRAGVSAWGTSARLKDSAFLCNPIALNTETRPNATAELVDEGGNDCGCMDQAEFCQVLATQLAAPEPLAEPAE